MKQTQRCAARAFAVATLLALSACTTFTPVPDQSVYAEPSAAGAARVRFVAKERSWAAYVTDNPALLSCYVFQPEGWQMLPFKRTRSDEAQLGVPAVQPMAARRASYYIKAGRGITLQVALERNNASSAGGVTVMHTQTCRDNVAFVPEVGKDYEVHANWMGDDRCTVSLWGVERVAPNGVDSATESEPQGKLVPVPYALVELPTDDKAFAEMCTPQQRSKQARALPAQP